MPLSPDDSWPEQVYLIGAGRWARVIGSVLLALLPAGRRLTIVSANHPAPMKQWAAALSPFTAAQDIEVVTEIPSRRSGGTAAIVANSAKDHFGVTRDLLLRRVPVLVEKPLALSAAEAQALVSLSRETGTALAVSHIVLFASYISTFQGALGGAPPPGQITFDWSEALEERYGEAKRYDAGLPVIADVFPNIYVILTALMPDAPIAYRSLQYSAGGARVGLLCDVNGIPCQLSIARNVETRARVLRFETPPAPITFDFGQEPGSLTQGETSISGDPDWARKQSPLTQQLAAFLKGASRGHVDPRLNPEIDLAASRLVDVALIDYYRAQAGWLAESPANEAELQYAMEEMKADTVCRFLPRQELKD